MIFANIRPQRLARPLLVSLLVGLVGCSPIDLVNTASRDSHYTKHGDIEYGRAARQQLDVYSPTAISDSAPVVVFYYGGGWKSGDRASYEFVASALTKAGMTVVIPDYRLFPDVVFPAFVEDSAEALAWTVRNISAFGGNADQLFVMGHSAGAHIAALLALDRRYLSDAGIDASIVRGMIGLSGPYDFLPLERGYLEDVFPEATRARSQPIRYVSSDAPATLLIHGDDDNTVRIANSTALADVLRACGVPVELKTYDGVGHARVVAAIAPPLDFLGGTLQDTTDFIQREARQRVAGVAAAPRAQQCGTRFPGY